MQQQTQKRLQTSSCDKSRDNEHADGSLANGLDACCSVGGVPESGHVPCDFTAKDAITCGVEMSVRVCSRIAASLLQLQFRA
jgi:hypothetical protein